jgi:predicted cytidylate kinase
MNRITLSGFAGSGKTTIGKTLAKTLRWEFISIGNFSREYADNYGMDINSFQNFCQKNPEIDQKIDNHFTELINKKSNVIIDYRLGYYFINNTFNVLLQVSKDEAVNRLLKAGRSKEFKEQSVEHIGNIINKRNNLMKQRFIDIYKTDFTDTNNYDLVINTDKYKNIESIIDLIINKANLCTY